MQLRTLIAVALSSLVLSACNMYQVHEEWKAWGAYAATGLIILLVAVTQEED